MLKDKILNKASGILTYGITPPKFETEPSKVLEIAFTQLERIKPLPIDGLILYDIQDEKDRITIERPFPYLKTINPDIYGREYLKELSIPKIIYRCIGKYSEEEHIEYLTKDTTGDRFSVYVGVAADNQEVKLTLPEAYELTKTKAPNMLLGGVVIPERHMLLKDEHLRIAAKIKSGCNFFVSQAVYNVEAAKNFLSDYYYYMSDNGLDMVPIIINISPCGSIKTMEFMEWLGISIPKWLENDLMHSKDILEKSLDLSKNIFSELYDYGREKGIPLGCSIESVSTRKVEIEASIQLVKDIKKIIDSYI